MSNFIEDGTKLPTGSQVTHTTTKAGQAANWNQIAQALYDSRLAIYELRTVSSSGSSAIADPTHTGLMSTVTQSFGGDKTFLGNIAALNLSGTNTGNVTLGAVGSTPSATGASLSGQILTLQPADATHPGIITTGAQVIAGDKTFTGQMGFSKITIGAITITAGNSAPTTGAQVAGSVVYNTAPELGGNVGWICISSGTPGTWAQFGLISV